MSALKYAFAAFIVFFAAGNASAATPEIETFFFNKRVEGTQWIVIGATPDGRQKRCDVLKKLDNGDIIVLANGTSKGSALEVDASSPRWNFGSYGRSSRKLDVTVSFRASPNESDEKSFQIDAYPISNTMIIINDFERKAARLPDLYSVFAGHGFIEYISSGAGPDIVITADGYSAVFSLSGYQRVQPILVECMNSASK
ncbi:MULTISPECIES: hypothetical protein [unclassified Xanthobacter]|uniref:hypothetical protein n=1 Tax=unclassified Xanthobacter TaxID=2623496 RepID=UPI001F3F4DF0|nr:MULTISPECIES: hypothetical protein [unclassified Xanthobacter]